MNAKETKMERIAQATEVLWTEIMGSMVEGGLTPKEVVQAQMRAPSLKKEREKQKRAAARQMAAAQVDLFGGLRGMRHPLQVGYSPEDQFLSELAESEGEDKE